MFPKSRRWKARMWWLLQSVAFVAMITTPLWIKRDLARAGIGLQPNVLSWTPEASTHGAISSEVVHLDYTAEALAQPRPLAFTVSSRQLRFKAPGRLPAPSTRRPAAAGERAEGWELSHIDRLPRGRTPPDAEAIPFVHTGESAPERAEIASVYVELDDGANDFVVTYRNARGAEKKVNLVVRFQRNG